MEFGNIQHVSNLLDCQQCVQQCSLAFVKFLDFKYVQTLT